MIDTLEQLMRVNIMWALALILVYASLHLLRVRSPRTRYNIMWFAYCAVLPVSIFSFFYRREIVVDVPLVPAPSTIAPATSSGIAAVEIVALAFAILMLLGLAHFLIRWLALSWRTRNLTPCADPRVGTVIEQLKSELGVHTGVTCYESDILASPCSLGLRRPAIIMAGDVITGASDAALTHIVAHELTHIRHRDYARNLFQKLVRSLFVFNPVAHLFNTRLDEMREVACDRDVIEATGIDRRAYAQTLLEMGLRLREQWAGSPSVALLRHRSKLMKRISCMRINHTRDSAIKTVILGMLVMIVFVVIACSNSEEVTGPVSNATESSQRLAAIDALHDENGNTWFSEDGAKPVGEDGTVWFIDENGDKALVEFSGDASWTSQEEFTSQLHELSSEYHADPDAMSKEDLAKQRDMKVQLHTMMSQDDFEFGDNGEARGHFIDEYGNKTTVDLKDGAWQAEGMGEVELKQLKELHEEKIEASED